MACIDFLTLTEAQYLALTEAQYLGMQDTPCQQISYAVEAVTVYLAGPQQTQVFQNELQ